MAGHATCPTNFKPTPAKKKLRLKKTENIISSTNFKPTAAKKSGQNEIFQALILNLNQKSWSQQFNETLPESQRTQKLTPRLGLNLATTWHHLH